MSATGDRAAGQEDSTKRESRNTLDAPRETEAIIAAVMELNDHLREMLKELGQAINESISGSGRVHESIQRIRDEGYNLYMVLDAKVGVNKPRGPRRSRGRSAPSASGASRTSRAGRVPHQREGPSHS